MRTTRGNGTVIEAQYTFRDSLDSIPEKNTSWKDKFDYTPNKLVWKMPLEYKKNKLKNEGTKRLSLSLL